MIHFYFISVTKKIIPVSVIPTVDGDNVILQVLINVICIDTYRHTVYGYVE